MSSRTFIFEPEKLKSLNFDWLCRYVIKLDFKVSKSKLDKDNELLAAIYYSFYYRTLCSIIFIVIGSGLFIREYVILTKNV